MEIFDFLDLAMTMTRRAKMKRGEPESVCPWLVCPSPGGAATKIKRSRSRHQIQHIKIHHQPPSTITMTATSMSHLVLLLTTIYTI
jgi:hypothetical protein